MNRRDFLGLVAAAPILGKGMPKALASTAGRGGVSGLPVGRDGQVLQADSCLPGGVAWVTISVILPAKLEFIPITFVGIDE